MNDAISVVALAAARRLEADHGPALTAEVEAALARWQPRSAPEQYSDPIGVASLIVAIATLAWSVYADLRRRMERPASEVISRTVRVSLRQNGEADPPGEVVDVVVGETIRAADEELAAASRELTEN
jgi:hypothetical protein